MEEESAGSCGGVLDWCFGWLGGSVSLVAIVEVGRTPTFSADVMSGDFVSLVFAGVWVGLCWLGGSVRRFAWRALIR